MDQEVSVPAPLSSLPTGFCAESWDGTLTSPGPRPASCPFVCLRDSAPPRLAQAPRLRSKPGKVFKLPSSSPFLFSHTGTASSEELSRRGISTSQMEIRVPEPPPASSSVVTAAPPALCGSGPRRRLRGSPGAAGRGVPAVQPFTPGEPPLQNSLPSPAPRPPPHPVRMAPCPLRDLFSGISASCASLSEPREGVSSLVSPPSLCHHHRVLAPGPLLRCQFLDPAALPAPGAPQPGSRRAGCW